MNKLSHPNNGHACHKLMWRATTIADRWLIVSTALLISSAAWHLATRPAGQRAVVHRDNHPVLTLSLANNQKTQVEGRLGPVAIQVQDGQIRLLEYASPRMIGTRSGWISASGAILACIPCGILIQVEGQVESQVGKDRTNQSGTEPFDGIAR